MAKKLLLHNLSIPYPRPSAGLYDFDQNGIFFAHPGDVLLTRSKFSTGYLSFLTACGMEMDSILFLSPEKKCAASFDGLFRDDGFVEQLRSKVKGIEEFDMDTFMASSLEVQFATTLGVKTMSNRGFYEEFATKSTFRKLAKEVGIPVPRGFMDQYGVLNTAIRAGALFLTGFGEVIIKDDLGVAGIGSMRIPRNDFLNAIMQLDEESPKTVVVEGWYGTSSQSPSIQFHIDDAGGTHFVSKHVQHFHGDRIRYRGCSSQQEVDRSIAAQLFDEGTRFSEYIAAMGYRGYVGLNAIVPRPGELLWVELNPRRVMSSYPFQICQRLYGGRSPEVHYTSLRIQKKRWVGKGIDDILSELEALLYTKDKQKGVIPFDHGLLRETGQLTLAAFSFERTDPGIMLTHAETI